MKFSQFNSIIPYNNQFALFNSFNQKFLLIVPELKELLNAAVHEGVDNLESIHPTFYQYLKEQEFIIDSNANEIDKVKEISKQVDENITSFILTINPTMNCNFKCWYCYETHIKQSKLTTTMISRINRFIDNTFQNPNLNQFTLSFFGGEPLLYFNKDVKPIINHYINQCRIKNILPTISFTTNGYLIDKDFIDYFDSIQVKCSLQITLDGYKEEHDQVRFVNKQKGSYQEIINNIRLLVLNKFYVRLRINYTDKNIHNTNKITEEFLDIPQELTNTYLLFDFHRVWQDHKLDNTSVVLNSNIDTIRENGFNATGGYAPNNVKESCYADKRNSAVINYNGDIYKCTARDFTKENRAGYINEYGELVWENNYLDRRMDAKFKNKPCLSCRIMPLCNGGCSQHAMEKAGEDYCVYLGDESEKDKVVKTIIDNIAADVYQEQD
jgi:uncharacterized protein